MKRILKNSRRLVGRRTYTAGELLTVLGVHRQTIRSWRQNGLGPLDRSAHPWLYLGRAVKEFLNRRANSRKTKLQQDEFWCLRCRAARKSKPEKAGTIVTGKTIGADRISVMRVGECECCRCPLRRVGSMPAPNAGSAGWPANGDKEY